MTPVDTASRSTMQFSPHAERLFAEIRMGNVPEVARILVLVKGDLRNDHSVVAVRTHQMLRARGLLEQVREQVQRLLKTSSDELCSERIHYVELLIEKLLVDTLHMMWFQTDPSPALA